MSCNAHSEEHWSESREEHTGKCNGTNLHTNFHTCIVCGWEWELNVDEKAAVIAHNLASYDLVDFERTNMALTILNQKLQIHWSEEQRVWARNHITAFGWKGGANAH